MKGERLRSNLSYAKRISKAASRHGDAPPTRTNDDWQFVSSEKLTDRFSFYPYFYLYRFPQCLLPKAKTTSATALNF
jgi:hypothetical protein